MAKVELVSLEWHRQQGFVVNSKVLGSRDVFGGRTVFELGDLVWRSGTSEGLLSDAACQPRVHT